MPTPRKPRRDRRAEIADAALRVAARDGVVGITHRAVADEADITLGLTTYYFATITDLITLAMERGVADYAEVLEEWAVGLSAANVAEKLAALLESKTTDRDRLRVEYELHFAAMRIDQLRPLATRCQDMLPTVLAPFCGASTARHLDAAYRGYELDALLRDRPIPAAEVRPSFEHVVGARTLA
ncbi:hypothetical protein ABCS02_19515 [Microbacterium sp. X-17]|uniref:TetR/AcrR family transcriptional regulator n=1 Tax=Microbacterium sp. X-17 TaxID=3144404 RepID=UPI0031F4C118